MVLLRQKNVRRINEAALTLAEETVPSMEDRFSRLLARHYGDALIEKTKDEKE